MTLLASWSQIERELDSVKGSFTPEQFGVFLNMYSWEVEDNYLIAFHENYHHWQMVFTPYGHLNWGCDRTVSTEIINSWLEATKDCPTSRCVPAADILPCKDIKQASCVAKILLQDTARQMVALRDRVWDSPWLQKLVQFPLKQICPTICLNEESYQMNGIDILEGWAKFQEAVLAYIVEGKHFWETINPQNLRPEYYSALHYFMNRIGPNRILEFPVVCELALSSSKLSTYDHDGIWKQYHPAWRFIKIVDVISEFKPSEYLVYDEIKTKFLDYVQTVLKRCAYAGWEENWKGAEEYASQAELNISRDMLRAIQFKRQYPWALSYPFCDSNVLLQMKEFHPYYYITSDQTSYTVNSESLGNEVMFENHYQAFSHQICGHISARCLDRGKIQCGFSYYGIQSCQYQINGTCDGHVDCHSDLPSMVLDENSNVLEGCTFDIFLSLMGVKVKDLSITDVGKKIDPDMLTENIKQLQFEGKE